VGGEEFLERLKGGDRRSIGRVPEVVAKVLANPGLFSSLFRALNDPDPLVRMRASDAVEKITARTPEILAPYRKELIRIAETAKQQEVRWHVAQLLSRVRLSRPEREKVVGIMSRYLKDNSKIVRTFAMQALADIASEDVELRRPILKKLEAATRSGSPAMKARGRKLLAELRRLE
jgi:hypothetical protein